MLRRVKGELIGGEHLQGVHKEVWGVADKELAGNVSKIRGDVSGIWGSAEDIEGEVGTYEGCLDEIT